LNAFPPTLGWYHRTLQSVLMRIRPAPLAALLKRVLGVRRIVIALPQGRYVLDPVSTLGIALTSGGGYEPEMQATLEKFLMPGKSFVDLGAMEGYFTVQGARLCSPGGRVLAIEPQQRLLPVIEENLRLNGSSNVTVLNAAVSRDCGKARIHLATSMNWGGSGLHRHTKYALPTQEVEMLTLEQALDRAVLAAVDLLKMDIEGFEHEAVLGSPKVFHERRIKALALEVHPTILADRGLDAGELTACLSSAGYRHTQPFGNSVWVAPGE